MGPSRTRATLLFLTLGALVDRNALATPASEVWSGPTGREVLRVIRKAQAVDPNRAQALMSSLAEIGLEGPMTPYRIEVLSDLHNQARSILGEPPAPQALPHPLPSRPVVEDLRDLIEDLPEAERRPFKKRLTALLGRRNLDEPTRTRRLFALRAEVVVDLHYPAPNRCRIRKDLPKGTATIRTQGSFPEINWDGKVMGFGIVERRTFPAGCIPIDVVLNGHHVVAVIQVSPGAEVSYELDFDPSNPARLIQPRRVAYCGNDRLR